MMTHRPITFPTPTKPLRLRVSLLASLVLLACGLGLSPALAKVTVQNLRCEYLANPLGIDTPQPRLSWVLESGERGQTQTAYQVLVASTEAQLKEGRADLWDSGKVLSDENIQVNYQGKPLDSCQRCFWAVRVWDQNGKVSSFSRPAYWEMGLLTPAQWQAQWIGRTTDTNALPAPLLRRTFSLKDKVKQARAYICGLGYYELHLNGKKVGDHLLDPAYTRYDKRALYVTYDVTDELRRGKNAVGVMLGNGWYNVQTRAVWDFHQAPWRGAAKVILVLRVEYANGETEIVGTGPEWKSSTGPILFNSIYGGETYDARAEKPGWDLPGYDDSAWDPVVASAGPGGRLVAQMMPPIKAEKVLRPVKVTEPKPGVFLFDMGQNLAGFAELVLRAPAGTKVVMKYGERLGKDGMLDRADIAQHVIKVDASQRFQTDTYIAKGQGLERWHSRFDYHGFQ